MATLVVTKGRSSLSVYSERLSEQLPLDGIRRISYPIETLPSIDGSVQSTARLIREAYRLGRSLRDENGLVHFTNQFLGRYSYLLKAPYVITVHDLIRYIDLTKRDKPLIAHISLPQRLYFRLDFQAVKSATRVIAVSQNTKRDLVERLGIPEERIVVVYNGVELSRFKPLPGRPIEYPYILYVGSEQPRKNFTGLLAAFAKLKNETAFADLKLVKVGQAGQAAYHAGFRRATLQAIEKLGLQNDVLFTEYVREEDLPFYYSGAECLIHPSLYEGFGLTVLEAMACGCPVVTSSTTSLGEIFSDAALTIDPLAINAITESMRQILTDTLLKEELRAKGLALARQFSWEKTAQETLKVYQTVENSVRN